MSEKNKKTLGREIIEGLTEFRDAIRSGERLSKKYTIRTVELDLEELEPNEYGADDVRRTRELLCVSQAVFACMLGVSKECVEKWEQGGTVTPIARRLLDMINNDRDHWLGILAKSVKEKQLSS